MNIVYHSSSCKHRLLAKTNSHSISLIRRTLTAEHEVVGSNPGWTTESLVFKNHCMVVFSCYLVASLLLALLFILLVVGPQQPFGCHSISQPDYSGPYPLVHLYSKDNSIENLSQKTVHVIFVSVTSIEGSPPSREKGHFFWVPKNRFNLHSGNTLAPKT